MILVITSYLQIFLVDYDSRIQVVREEADIRDAH
jgi:hypothetical protein